MGFLSNLLSGGAEKKLTQAAGVQRAGITAAEQKATPLLQQGFQAGAEQLQPFQQVAPIGAQSLQRAQTLLGLSGTPDEQQAALQGIQSSPLQQFRLSEANRALQRQGAATGLLGSGQLARQQAEATAGITAQGQQEQLQNLLGLAGASFAPSLPAAQQAAGLQTQRGQTLANLASQSELARAGVQSGVLQGQAQQRSGMASGLLGLGGMALGGALGGPLGASIGGKVGGLF